MYLSPEVNMPDFSHLRSEKDIFNSWGGNCSQPLISILCITYNHADFICNALDSFLMQETNFPFEIIIHDDASTDGNQDVIRNYERNYPNIIKVVYQEENQYSKGRRALSFFQGLSNAKYLAVCEGDDYWTDPLKIQKQVTFLENNPEYVITGHDACVINQSGHVIKSSKLPDSYKKDFEGHDLEKDKAWILTMSWVFRNVIKDFAPERHMVKNGDKFFVSLLGAYGKSHFHDDIAPAAYRVHSGGVWSMINQSDRADEHVNTLFWMYRYYKRVDRDDLASYYYSCVAEHVIDQFVKSEGSVIFLYKKVLSSSLKKVLKKLLGERCISKVRFFLRKAFVRG